MFITESGRMIVVNGMRGTTDIISDLRQPKIIRQLEFDTSRLKCSILTKHTHTTVLCDDGKLSSYGLRSPTEEVKDVTGFAEDLTKDEKNPNGMVLKWYGHCALQYYFLFE